MRKQLIYTLIIGALTIVTPHSLQAQIPYLPMKTTLTGATEISDFANFTAPAGDFTITLQATQGQSVRVPMLNCMAIEYTPKSTCKLRIAVKDEVAYIYEGSTYIGTVNPVSKKSFQNIFNDTDNNVDSTGIYDPHNLITNPGFETKGAKISGDSAFYVSKWIASVTSSLATSYIASGKVPAASGSEGTNVFRWSGEGTLTQGSFFTETIMKMEANAHYQLRFRTFSSESKNAPLSFYVGIAKLTKGAEDIAKSEVFSNTSTTPYTAQDFTYTFETPSSLPLKRFVVSFINKTTGAPVYFDRITLVKGDSVAVGGFTGASSAAVYAGTAYAPQVSLPSGAYFDMNPYLTNPGFEQGQTLKVTTCNNSNGFYIPNGWTFDTFPTASSWDYAVNGTTKVSAGSQSFAVRFNWGTSRSYTLSQNVYNLPAGRYSLKAMVLAENSAQSSVVLYAKRGNSSLGVSTKAPTTSFTQLSVPEFTLPAPNIPISLGFTLNYKSDTDVENSTVFDLDNVCLQYYGNGSEDGVDSLSTGDGDLAPDGTGTPQLPVTDPVSGYIDVTANYIANASFENPAGTIVNQTTTGGVKRPIGWSMIYVTKGTTDQGIISSGLDGTGISLNTAAKDSSNYYYINLKSVANYITLYQSGKKLPVGKYDLTFWYKTSGASAFTATCTSYTKSYSATLSNNVTDWTQGVVTFYVSDENVSSKIAVTFTHSDATDNGALFLDGFRLFYRGIDYNYVFTGLTDVGEEQQKPIIYVADHRIYVEGITDYAVHTLQGLTVSSDSILAPGTYLVTVGNATYKIQVM